MSNDFDAAPAAQLERPVANGKTDIARRTSRAVQLRAQGRHREAADLFAEVAELLPGEWLPQYNAGAVFLEAGSPADAVPLFARTVELNPTADGFALLAHALALAGDNAGSRANYERAVTLEPRHFDAHWGLFEVDQLLGDDQAALEHQARALAERSLVTIPALRAPARTTILELCIAGTFAANIPLDFILDRERITVHKLYLGVHPIPALPPYDIVFNTIADAPNATAALRAAETFIAGQTRPVLDAPQYVPLTARDAVAARFAHSATVAAAATRQVNRMTVHAARPAFPFLIRPLDSHAGNDLAKIDAADALHAYLESVPEEEDFYVSDFVDYRNADGFYRKYRIVFVDGVPYPVHLAISPRWMIHYYNAPMAENAWMRDEEHAFMRDLDSVFTGRAADGLREIAAAFPLDYFGIDCSIAPDGRVLLFEASTAMIVHLRDPIAMYPYKAQYVPRVIAALERLFDDRLRRAALT
jgi:tetratricopeptide (TPR) repeat protein